jgi:hypothetical protein
MELSDAMVLDVELDALWRQWSAAPLPIENTTEAVPDQPALGTRDTVSPRASAALRSRHGSLTWTGRLGYAFEPAALPAQRGPHWLLDNHRHVFALGAGLRWRPGGSDAETRGGKDEGAGGEGGAELGLDAFAQVHHLVSRTHTAAPDVQGALAGASLRTSGTLWAAGAALQVQF